MASGDPFERRIQERGAMSQKEKLFVFLKKVLQ